MQIRAVVADDIDTVVAFWRDVFPEYNDPARPQRDPRTNIVRKLAFGDSLFWLAQDDGRVIGTVMAGYDGHRGWIYSLGVDRARRDHGIGRTLLAHAEDALRTLGCPKVNVQVLDSNGGAREFWQAAGYTADPVVSFGRRLR